MHLPSQSDHSNAPQQHDVFLSYSRADEAIMQRVKNDLEREGLSVWIDQTGIPPGTPSWLDAIQTAIDHSRCLLVIFSPEAKKSQWVGEELNYARLQEKQIFSLLARGAPRNAVRFGFSAHQWIDIRKDEDYAAGIRQLIEAICDHLGKASAFQRRERVEAEEAERKRLEEEERRQREAEAEHQRALQQLLADRDRLKNDLEQASQSLTPDEWADFGPELQTARGLLNNSASGKDYDEMRSLTDEARSTFDTMKTRLEVDRAPVNPRSKPNT